MTQRLNPNAACGIQAQNAPQTSGRHFPWQRVSLLAVHFLLFAAGCATEVPRTDIRAKSFAVVPLEQGAKIRIIAPEDKVKLNKVTEALSAAITKDKTVSIIESGRPDYWLSLTPIGETRVDTTAQQKLNFVPEVTKKETSAGGEEAISSIRRKTAASAITVMATLYQADHLKPLYYADLTAFDSESLDEAGSAKLRDDQAYYDAFAEQLAKVVAATFLTTPKKQTVMIPVNADPQLTELLNDYPHYQKKFETRAKDKTVCGQPFTEFLADVDKGSDGPYDGQEELMESKLASYYLVCLADEAGTYVPAKLRDIHARLLAILARTKNDVLQRACMDSLARIETTLAGIAR